MTTTEPVGLSVWSGLGRDTVPYLDAVADGFGSLWFPDHLQSNEVGVMEGWTLFTACLERFPDAVCGHQVLCNEFRPPAMLAKMVATASVLSGGRVVLGIGAGWHRAEADAYGLAFPPIPERVERLTEAIELIRALWTGEPVHHAGRHFVVRGAVCRPVPESVPPVMIGGSGEQHLLRAVATSADRWNHIYRSVDEFARKRSVLHEHCERIGRDPGEIVPVLATHVLIGETEQDLRRLQGRDDVRPVDRNGIAGTPDQCAELLLAGIAAGAGDVIVGFADSPRTDGTELFVEAVLPLVRRAITGVV